MLEKKIVRICLFLSSPDEFPKGSRSIPELLPLHRRDLTCQVEPQKIWPSFSFLCTISRTKYSLCLSYSFTPFLPFLSLLLSLPLTVSLHLSLSSLSPHPSLSLSLFLFLSLSHKHLSTNKWWCFQVGVKIFNLIYVFSWDKLNFPVCYFPVLHSRMYTRLGCIISQILPWPVTMRAQQVNRGHLSPPSSRLTPRINPLKYVCVWVGYVGVG